MQDSGKRIIFRFVSAIQIASRVISSPEESIKIILTHNINIISIVVQVRAACGQTYESPASLHCAR